MAFSDITAWPLLSDKDGKVICPKELAGHHHLKYFGMSGNILWKVKPDGHFSPMTEDLQLGLASKASAEEGVNVYNTPLLGGQSQVQEDEEQVEELADNGDEAGQNTSTPPSHIVVNMSPGAAS